MHLILILLTFGIGGGVFLSFAVRLMDLQRLQGLTIGEMVGFGGCGRVYHAQDEKAVAFVVKIFDENAISRPLLATTTARLQSNGWPSGVMPLLASDFTVKPACWVTPLMLMHGPGSLSRTLQSALAEHPGANSWKLVRSMARALAQMHLRRVAHGNLKPGNVFFNDDGEVLLSDWAMGNIAGFRQFSFTDAVLYQAPEQLRNPTGYLDGEGYRWDVFSFGVLAYRVLTGKFPRCEETFSFVAPENGTNRREGIHADLAKIARNLENEPEVTWPDSPQNVLEASFREWIERCLSLDPIQRPFSMMEVSAGFDSLEIKESLDAERETRLIQQRSADRRSKVFLFTTGIIITAAMLGGGLWQRMNQQLQQERAASIQSLKLVASATAAASAAVAEKAIAETAREEAVVKMMKSQKDLSEDRDISMSLLEASRINGDRLFSWAMEKDNLPLAPLDGSNIRLKELEKYFVDFMAKTADEDNLADERARVALQLAEVSISGGDAVTASKRFSEAKRLLLNTPADSALKLRLAKDSLLLAMLQQSGADPGAEAAFIAARAAIQAVEQNAKNTDRLAQLLAILDFHEAQTLAARGEDAKALSQLMRATQTLNSIADQYPETVSVRSELAACYLSSAAILEGMGSLGDAREVRALASVEFVKLLKNNPKDFSLRFDLAGCYAAMAESAVLSGDLVGADSISQEAMKLLDQLVIEQPDRDDVSIRRAVQLGLRGGIKRDRGLPSEAIHDYDEGMKILEKFRSASPANGMALFQLAQLWWQKGKMLGMTGQCDEEIALIRQADETLQQLEPGPSSAGYRWEQVQISRAYLLGDLGHALQLENQKSDAVKAFTDSISLWQNLIKSRPESVEYAEGLDWCRQRLEDLK